MEPVDAVTGSHIHRCGMVPFVDFWGRSFARCTCAGRSSNWFGRSTACGCGSVKVVLTENAWNSFRRACKAGTPFLQEKATAKMAAYYTADDLNVKKEKGRNNLGKLLEAMRKDFGVIHYDLVNEDGLVFFKNTKKETISVEQSVAKCCVFQIWSDSIHMISIVLCNSHTHEIIIGVCAWIFCGYGFNMVQLWTAGYFVNLFNDMKLKKTAQTFLALALCCWNRE